MDSILLKNKRFLALNIPVTISSEDEHDPFSEKLIKSLKERTRMVFPTVRVSILSSILVQLHDTGELHLHTLTTRVNRSRNSIRLQ